MLLHVIIMTIIVLLVFIKVFSKLTAGRCKSPVCLLGKTVLITGGNSGIGFETALALAGRGCRLIIADKDDCQKSKEKIILETGNTNIVLKQFDLASLASVRKFAKNINETEARLDVLINNAGIIGSGHVYTQDGLNKVMQVNHFGAFLLTHLLTGLLKKSTPSRIIFVSSIGAYFSNLTVENLNFPKSDFSNIISEFILYGNSKLCSIIASKGFAEKLKETGVTSNSLHPGVVRTPIIKKFSYGVGKNKFQYRLIYFFVRHVLGLFFKAAEEGAQTTIHLALAKEVEKVTGKYFMDCKPFKIPGPAKDLQFSSKIWKVSEEYVKLAPEEKLS